MIMDLAERHAGRRRDIARRQGRIAALAQNLFGRREKRGAGINFFCHRGHLYHADLRQGIIIETRVL